MSIDKRILNFGLTIRYLITLSLLEKPATDSYKLILDFFKNNVKEFIVHYNKIFVNTKVNNVDFTFSLFYYLTLIRNIDTKILSSIQLDNVQETITSFCNTVLEKIKDLHVKEKENYTITLDINKDPLLCITVFRYGLTNELIDIIELSDNTKTYDELFQSYVQKAKEMFTYDKVISETYLDSYSYSAIANEDTKKRIKSYMSKQTIVTPETINSFEVLKKAIEKLKSLNVPTDDISNFAYKILCHAEEDDIKQINSILYNTSKLVSICESIVKTNIQNSYQLQGLLNTGNTNLLLLYYGYIYKLNQRNTLSSIIDDTFENRSKIMVNPLFLNKNQIIKENDEIELLQHPNLFCSIHTTDNLVKDITNFVSNFNNSINIQNLIVGLIKDIAAIAATRNKYDIMQLVSFIDFDGPLFENSFKYKFVNTINLLDDENKMLLFEDVIAIVLTYINFKKIKTKLNVYNIQNEELMKILEELNAKGIKINPNICGFIQELFNYYKYDKEYYSPTVIRSYSYFFDRRAKNPQEIINELDSLSFDDVKMTVMSKLKQLM